MKRTLLLAFLVGIAFQSSAQQLSVGYRTGINNWLRVSINNNSSFIEKTTDGEQISWNNEVFVRHQTKRSLAFEGGISYTKRNLEGIYYPMGCFFGNTGERIEPLNTSYTELNIGIQYKINIPSCMKCPLLNKISNYVGISLHPQVVNIVTRYTNTSYDNTTLALYKPSTMSDKYIMLAAAINHTLVYKINKQFNAVSNVSLKYRPDNKYSYNSNTRIGLSIGASYNLN